MGTDAFKQVLFDAIALLRGDGLPPEEADEQRDRLLAGFRWILVDEYQDIDAEDIAQAVGQEVPARYTLVGCGRMFPQAIDSDTFVPLDTDRARELIQIIRDIES